MLKNGMTFNYCGFKWKIALRHDLLCSYVIFGKRGNKMLFPKILFESNCSMFNMKANILSWMNGEPFESAMC